MMGVGRGGWGGGCKYSSAKQTFAAAMTLLIRQSVTALPEQRGECFLLFLFHSPEIGLCVPCILEAFIHHHHHNPPPPPAIM